MSLPKRKYKNNINVYQRKEDSDGKHIIERRQELLDEITINDTFLPDSIMHDDLDKGMLNFVIENFQVVSDDGPIPIIPKILTIQRWGEFTNNWEFSDDDGNVKVPFITVVRKPDVQPGTNLSTHKTIPVRKNFYYSSVPTWDGNLYGRNIYKIPQPVAVDITYEITIVCNKFRDLNKLNKIVMQEFSSRQSYTTIKGHYIPIILNSVSDSSPISSIDNRRFYLQTYNVTLLGLLIDKDEFEVKPALSRAILTLEIANERTFKKTNLNPELGFFSFNFTSNGVQTLYTVNDTFDIVIAVTVNGLVQILGEHYYYISGSNRITFIEPPLVGSIIEVIYFKGKFGSVISENGNILEIVHNNLVYDGNTTINFINNLYDVIYIDINGLVLNKNEHFTFNSNSIELLINPILDSKINMVIVYDLGLLANQTIKSYEFITPLMHEIFTYDGTTTTFTLSEIVKDVITIEYNGLLQLKNEYFTVNGIENQVTLNFIPIVGTEFGVIYTY